MPQFIVYPELDDEFNFPPAVRQALSESPEFSNEYATKEELLSYIDPNEMTSGIASKLDTSQKGQANGVAALDSNSKLQEANIPTRLSTAAMSGYAPKDSPAFTGTPTGITKTHVGLGNVNDTADVDKPVSAAQQAAIAHLATREQVRLGTLEFLMDPTNVWGPDGVKLNVPTHIDPAGGQVVHPAVVFIPEGWNGYKYWMAITAYPGGNDDHEDPNIVASHDGITWVTPPGLTNPIADADGQPEYHSDTDLRMGPNNTLYLFYRWYAGVAGSLTEEQLRFSKSTDGITWSAPQTFYTSDETNRRLLSPSLIYEDDRWSMYAVDIVYYPNRVVRLRSNTSDPMSGWSAPQTITHGTMIANREPWHIYVTKMGGRYYGLLNDVVLGGGTGGAGDLVFISSSDGLTFTSSAAPVIPKAVTGKHDQLYQSTMVPAIEDGRAGFRVWYSGWNADNTWWLFRTFISEGRWKSLTLANAWVNYVGGGGYSQTGLRYKKSGRSATLDGAVKSGAVGTMITQLPLDVTPQHTIMLPVNSGGTIGLVYIIGKANPTVAGQVLYFSGPEAPSYMPVHIKYDLD